MKIRLTKPFPQPSLGKVIPAGVIINAPAALSARLLHQGIGQPVHEEKDEIHPVATPETGHQKKPARKKVKHGG